MARIMTAGGAGANTSFLAENIAEFALALVPYPQKVQVSTPTKNRIFPHRSDTYPIGSLG